MYGGQAVMTSTLIVGGIYIIPEVRRLEVGYVGAVPWQQF